MRKQTKLAVGFSAAALLVVGASMTSFAATRGWQQEDGTWYYYGNDGETVTDKWKNYNGNYFYLGDDGAMLTNQLVEDGDNYYYVDANGAMVKNKWVAIEADDSEDQDVDYRWYFFTSTGKAYKDTDKKIINGKKYGFDADGKMLFGFVDDSRSIINNDDDAVLDCTRYYGTNDDGAMHTGWLRYEDGFNTDEYDDDFYYFWFDSNGKKKVGQEKKISGKVYSFDDKGVMNYEWVNDATVSGKKTLSFFSAADNGSLSKSAWFWNELSDDEQELADDDDEHWFRTNAQGYVLRDCTKKVNGKWYVFDKYGRMMTGLVQMTEPTVSASGCKSDHDDDVDRDEVTGDMIMNDDDGKFDKLMWFGDDEEHDGSLKTGSSIKIDLADDTYTFAFEKTGKAYNTVKNSKLYKHGILVNAGDDRYKIAHASGNTYLVGSTGTILKSINTKYKDGDDQIYILLKMDDADKNVVLAYVDNVYDNDDATEIIRVAKQALKDKEDPVQAVKELGKGTVNY